MTLEPDIIPKKSFTLLGCVYYGDPFHEAAEWTYENEIGKLWMRFQNLYQRYSFLLSKISIEPGVGYEIHIEPEEYKKTKQYYIFVGTEVSNFEEVPMEMFIKILPTTEYLKVTTKGDDSKAVEDLFKKWIPEHNYEQAYPYIIQAYDYKRYKGLEDKTSEIDWYIPVKTIKMKISKMSE